LTLFLGFDHLPLLDSKMTERIKNELALTSHLHCNKTLWLIFYAILREVRCLRRPFLVFSASKMPPRLCVVQDCSRVSDKELDISARNAWFLHNSPSQTRTIGLRWWSTIKDRKRGLVWQKKHVPKHFIRRGLCEEQWAWKRTMNLKSNFLDLNGEMYVGHKKNRVNQVLKVQNMPPQRLINSIAEERIKKHWD